MINVIILLLLLLGTIIGFKRGFSYQLVKMVGIFLVLILSFIFKNKLGIFLLHKFPIMNFGEGLQALNIIAYQFFAFIILFFLLSLVLRLLLILTKSFEKVVKATIVLAIPSKIFGSILGFIEYYIYIFFILVILTLPVFKVDLNKSKIACFILNNTPVISKKMNIKTLEEVRDIINSNSDDKAEEIIDIFIKNNIINERDLDKLIDKGKISDVDMANKS